MSNLTWYDNTVCAVISVLITLNLFQLNFIGVVLHTLLFIIYRDWRFPDDEF